MALRSERRNAERSTTLVVAMFLRDRQREGNPARLLAVERSIRVSVRYLAW